VNGSRYRLYVVVGIALTLSLGAAGCSKKDNTASTSTGPSTSAPSPGSTPGKGTSTTVAGATATPKANVCGSWPGGTGGAPESSKNPATSGYFIWQDVTGWHLRARGTASKDAFKGTVRASRDMTSVKEFPANSGIKVLELKKNVLTFEIPPSADLKGFDLVAGCQVDQLQFALFVGPNPASADSIFVGSQGKAVSPLFNEQKVA